MIMNAIKAEGTFQQPIFVFSIFIVLRDEIHTRNNESTVSLQNLKMQDFMKVSSF